ncbi:MAG TPA: hypothetical protein VN971_10615, partial [Thermoanaerobaculia bacterium]|nr:hypothetical protein [Thermoanaerobaculia bacterium]
NLYPWTQANVVAHDELIQAKRAYLNVPFFLVRAAIYFALWNAISYWLNKWAVEQDRTADPQAARNMQKVSAAGLVLYGLTITFASFDWLMSLEPHWYSTIYGVLVMGGQALSAMAFLIVVLVWLSRRPPLDRIVVKAHFHDLGNLTLAFVMLWAYFSFSQYLIIWSGNLPEEIPWYLRRLQGGWGWFGMALILLHFLLPFLLLLPASANRNPRTLVFVACLVVSMRFVDVFWLIRPASSPARLSLHWMDLAAPAGVLGVWFFIFLGQLLRRPLLPIHDPEFQEASEHGSH